MSQLSFLPIEIKDYEPTEPTATLKKIGYDTIGQKYAIKRIVDGQTAPPSEFIGYSVSRLCGIPTPDFAIVKDEKGLPAFASKWVDNAEPIASNKSNPEIISIVESNLSAISNIIAIDQVIHNPDRHLNNLLFKPVKPNILSFDFGGLNLLNKACGINTPHCKNNTRITAELLRRLKINSKTTTDDSVVIEKLRTIDEVTMGVILSEIPSEWLHESHHQAIIQWWKRNV